jgi:uncharacterized protein
MSKPFGIAFGTKLVKLARRTMEKLIEGNELSKKGSDQGLVQISPEKPPGMEYKAKRGVFVTIKKFKDRSLRGCIGFISPTPIWDAVQSAAALAAFEDPRFPPLRKEELGNVVIEVSVMTEPSLLQGVCREEYASNIRIGKDGLIIFNQGSSGLLLPQVPLEEKWDTGQFLDALCLKAGMPASSLDDQNTKLMRFQCQVFEELTPDGKVSEKELSGEPS